MRPNGFLDTNKKDNKAGGGKRGWGKCMVFFEHLGDERKYDCHWGKMVVRTFAYKKRKEAEGAERQAKER